GAFACRLRVGTRCIFAARPLLCLVSVEDCCAEGSAKAAAAVVADPDDAGNAPAFGPAEREETLAERESADTRAMVPLPGPVDAVARRRRPVGNRSWQLAAEAEQALASVRRQAVRAVASRGRQAVLDGVVDVVDAVSAGHRAGVEQGDEDRDAEAAGQ